MVSMDIPVSVRDRNNEVYAVHNAVYAVHNAVYAVHNAVYAVQIDRNDRFSPGGIDGLE